MATNVDRDRRVHVDRTDKRVHLQPNFEGDVGYGDYGGYGAGSDFKSRGPSTNQVFFVFYL